MTISTQYTQININRLSTQRDIIRKKLTDAHSEYSHSTMRCHWYYSYTEEIMLLQFITVIILTLKGINIHIMQLAIYYLRLNFVVEICLHESSLFRHNAVFFWMVTVGTWKNMSADTETNIRILVYVALTAWPHLTEALTCIIPV